VSNLRDGKYFIAVLVMRLVIDSTWSERFYDPRDIGSDFLCFSYLDDGSTGS
jgi:hypothetical protein